MRLLLCTSILLALAYSSTSVAKTKLHGSALADGFTPVTFVDSSDLSAFEVPNHKQKKVIEHYCRTLIKYFKKHGWKDKPCGDVHWQVDYKSKNGHPLIYAVFGKGKAITLLLSAVHPDEITPVPVGFRFARYLLEHPDVFINRDTKIVIAPLVNPDGFLRNTPTRTNSNGVDLNRNFLTDDWFKGAKLAWRKRGRAAKRYPGYIANSEIETHFQIGLIKKFSPDKILSIHAPLGFLDYDGPGDQVRVPKTSAEQQAKRLVYSISEKSRDYLVVDYNFYPGSLGNYAGQERNIPTVTLEFQTMDARKVDAYWKQFLPGILETTHYPFSIYQKP